jgi:hypothetical protein
MRGSKMTDPQTQERLEDYGRVFRIYAEKGERDDGLVLVSKAELLGAADSIATLTTQPGLREAEWHCEYQYCGRKWPFSELTPKCRQCGHPVTLATTPPPATETPEGYYVKGGWTCCPYCNGGQGIRAPVPPGEACGFCEKILPAPPPAPENRLEEARRQLDSLQPIVRDLERVVTEAVRIRAAYPDALTDEIVDRVALEFMAPPPAKAGDDG